MEEIFVAIEGFEDYLILNFGRVWSKKRNKYLTPTFNKGYLVITLCKDGVEHKKKLHRLVASRFVLNYFEGAEIDHIDGNRANNNANNLRWVSHKDNMNNPITTQRISNTMRGK